MLEDKLTRDERIRLEALAQSVAQSATAMRVSTSLSVIDTAKTFEAYIREGATDARE